MYISVWFPMALWLAVVSSDLLTLLYTLVLLYTPKIFGQLGNTYYHLSQSHKPDPFCFNCFQYWKVTSAEEKKESGLSDYI